MDVWRPVASAIGAATGRPFTLRAKSPVGGGSINQAFKLEGDDGSRYFLKLNEARHHPMFVAEATGLAAIADTGAIRVPRPIAHGVADRQSYLVLEYLPLVTHGDARALGIQLAALHRHTTKQFGFAQDNFIGTTPQPNSWSDDWIGFWRERRLGFQLQLAAENGYGGELQHLGRRLLDALPAFFAGYAPRPSLLHGDLWGGNHAYLADGTPAIFDPAACYGDRECDLAMTELFGGYPADFYAAYRATWPLDAGYENRRELYNLYHILNHANLFGGSYARQAEGMLRSLLASV
ncbi:MAG TPA: fructosamine kinase family protein [Sideroxyarcus sp.]|nr:fructosamine kinase family protein [Sideroxyarcus sp.]